MALHIAVRRFLCGRRLLLRWDRLGFLRGRQCGGWVVFRRSPFRLDTMLMGVDKHDGQSGTTGAIFLHCLRGREKEQRMYKTPPVLECVVRAKGGRGGLRLVVVDLRQVRVGMEQAAGAGAVPGRVEAGSALLRLVALARRVWCPRGAVREPVFVCLYTKEPATSLVGAAGRLRRHPRAVGGPGRHARPGADQIHRRLQL